MIGIFTRYLAVFMFIISLFGCGDADLEKAQLELKGAKESVSALKLENEKLLNQIYELQGEIERLESDNKRLVSKLEELKECSLKLLDSYGPGIWDVDEFMCPRFLRSVKSANINHVVEELNKFYEKEGLPKIFLKRIDKGIAYVGVEDEKMLTQQMGSHGATSYMKAVTYSLASVKGIDCVFFTFEWGDHAIPGEYCR